MAPEKRLLFVVNPPKFFLSHRLPIALAAQRAGYDVHVAVAETADTQAIRDAGLNVHVIPLTRSGSSPLRELATIRAIYDLYRRLSPSIVHHVTIKPVLYGTLAARLAKVPAVVNAISGLGYVFTAEGAKAALRRKLITWAYRLIFGHGNMKVIFQNSDDSGIFLKARIVRPDQCEYIKGSGVDLTVFRPAPEQPGPPVVVLPARLLKDKGVGEFVEAARLLKAEGVDARFVLVGESDFGNPTAVSETEINAWIAEGCVEWWGFRADMPEVLRQSHIVCLPSYREGLPKSLIEACAAGRPIVTTDVPGCRDVVTDGENGVLASVADSYSLALMLKKLIGDITLRQEMGRKSRTRAENEFSIKSVVDKHFDIYNHLNG